MMNLAAKIKYCKDVILILKAWSDKKSKTVSLNEWIEFFVEPFL